MNESRIDELLASSALGELTQDEERELDAALANDAALRLEHDADLDTAARVQAANTTTPPPSLKDRVMNAIDEHPRSSAADAHDVAATMESRGERAAGPPPVVSLDAARARRSPRWLPFAAAAAIALLVVGGVVATRQDSPDVVAQVIAADDAQTRTFNEDFPGQLRAVYSSEVDGLVVDGEDVRVLSSDETYQLWLVDDSGATGAQSVGVFRPDDDGRVAAAFDGTDPTGFVLGVTVEPAGGSSSPTEPIVATA